MSKRKTKKFGDKHKVVFLDIDGVLNSLDWFNSIRFSIDRKKHGYNNAIICNDYVLLLKYLKRKTNCKFVLSSSWRYFYFSKSSKSAKCLKRKLSKEGIYIYDSTTLKYPADSTYSETRLFGRGWQIKQYLHSHKEIKSFVIFDDDDGDLHLLGNGFIHILGNKGLSSEYIDRAINILNAF